MDRHVAISVQAPNSSFAGVMTQFPSSSYGGSVVNITAAAQLLDLGIGVDSQQLTDSLSVRATGSTTLSSRA